MNTDTRMKVAKESYENLFNDMMSFLYGAERTIFLSLESRSTERKNQRDEKLRLVQIFLDSLQDFKNSEKRKLNECYQKLKNSYVFEWVIDTRLECINELIRILEDEGAAPDLVHHMNRIYRAEYEWYSIIGKEAVGVLKTYFSAIPHNHSLYRNRAITALNQIKKKYEDEESGQMAIVGHQKVSLPKCEMKINSIQNLISEHHIALHEIERMENGMLLFKQILEKTVI